MGAEATIDARTSVDVPLAVRELTGGGAHVSVDAVGSPETCRQAILSLRKRGRHVQVGLLPAVLGDPPVPMSDVIAGELEIVGSHGMPARAYDEMLALVTAGRLRPELLVTGRIPLEEGSRALTAMDERSAAGVTIVEP